MSNKEALLAILKEHPASWHLLRKTPEGWDYRHEGEEHFPRLWAKAGRESYKATRRNVPAKVGEIFVPTPARIDALEEWARGWVSDVAPKIGVSLDWIHGDLFSPPSIEAASDLWRCILWPRMGKFRLEDMVQLAANRGNMLAMLYWTLRQHDLISPDVWGMTLRAVWVLQSVSFQTSIDLDGLETVKMFRYAGDAGLFNQNEKILSRNDIPERVTLYRGIAGEREKDVTIRSWTEKEEIAWMYADHRQEQGFGEAQVLSATFTKDQIAAMFDQENHEEWLIFPTENEVILQDRKSGGFPLYNFLMGITEK